MHYNSEQSNVLQLIQFLSDTKNVEIFLLCNFRSILNNSWRFLTKVWPLKHFRNSQDKKQLFFSIMVNKNFYLALTKTFTLQTLKYKKLAKFYPIKLSSCTAVSQFLRDVNLISAIKILGWIAVQYGYLLLNIDIKKVNATSHQKVSWVK